MASIYLRSRMWWISYTQNGVKVCHSLKTRDKASAKYRKNEIENKIAKGDRLLPDLKAPVFEIYEAFIASCEHRVAASTVNCYRYFLKPFLNVLGPAPISAITPARVQEYLNARITSKQYQPRTANHALKYIKALLNFAVTRGMLGVNPLSVLKPYRVDVLPPRFFTPAEAGALIEAARAETIAPMVATAIYTGMRLGELRRLCWQDVDLARGVIVVRIAKSRRGREIPIHPALLEILQNVRDMSGIDSGPCFDVANARRVWRRVRIKAGVPWAGWHSCRHTFASTLIMAGVDVITVSRLLGHSTLSTTAIYTHLTQDHVRDAVGKIATFSAPKNDTSPTTKKH